jgi:dihydrodipicolinate reductase
MRIAVAGATGRIGQLTVEILERAGNEAVPISRSAGVDAYTGAGLLAETAVAAPLRATLDIAGPRTEDLVDMARRTFAVRGQDVTLVPTWRGIFGTDMAGEVLLPGPGARLAPTTFDDWLAAGGR